MTATDTKTMTKNEALALVGDAKTNWLRYYKFSVTYSLDADELEAHLYYGGDSDSGFEMTPDESRSIKEWIEDGDGCRITRKSDGAVFEIEQEWY